MTSFVSPPLPHANDVSRRDLLQGAAAVGALGYGGMGTPFAAIADEQKSQASKPMTAYIGAATSRVDGRDKVTGAAKYAGEFKVPNMAYASVVSSTIAKGRIAGIDFSEAMKIGGVIAVLTHKNRPAMADNDKAYKDDVAPDKGSPFRPLYDDKIMFSGQPIAIVLADEWETARFAASLVRVEYQEESYVTDLEHARKDAFALEAPAKPRGDAAKAFAAADVRHAGEYYVPIEHHNPMELYVSTVTWDGDGKLTVYDKTQGVQNVQRYVCSIFNLNPKMCGSYLPLSAAHLARGFVRNIRWSWHRWRRSR